MVNPFKKLKEIADDVQRRQDEAVENLRDILPSGRGGNPPNLGGGNILGTGERQLLDRIPLEKVSFPANVPDSIGTRFKKSADIRKGRIEMDTTEAIREVINNPMIQLDDEMMRLINDPSILVDSGMNLMRSGLSDQFRFDKLEPKKKKKVSKYQKELGRQLKMLKKKHPRTRVTQLMKRAHRATRKALK